jgi:hypothetical protein
MLPEGQSVMLAAHTRRGHAKRGQRTVRTQEDIAVRRHHSAASIEFCCGNFPKANENASWHTSCNGSDRFYNVTISRRSLPMFTIQMSRNVLQSAACMLLSILIVTTTLTTGTLGVNYAVKGESYSVTVTQLS